MTTALWLLLAQGALGAFDTLYFHEWRARLPARGAAVAAELRLHAARDFVYAVVFATLPFVAWQGWWAALLAALLATEIGITLADFVVEDRVRAALGGVFPGERVTHAIMGIVYGAFLAFLRPHVARWWSAPTGLATSAIPAPPLLRAGLAVMAAGVFLSGVRDLAATRRGRRSRNQAPIRSY